VKRILLTGFEAFGEEVFNPSGEIARRLDGHQIAGHIVVGAVLPVVFGAPVDALKLLMREHRPGLVICLGLAAGRMEITPERVAINVDDARIPDNADQQPVDRPIVPRGPVGYWSKLPIKAIVRTLRAHGIPSSVSQTAGTFVCNHVFYGLMHELARTRSRVRGGFIHVPYAAGQATVGSPSMPFELMLKAVKLALETAVRVPKDVRAAGGREN